MPCEKCWQVALDFQRTLKKQQLDELKLGLIRFQRQLQGQSLVVGVELGVGLVGIKRAGQDLIEGVLAEYEQHNATVAER
ncbi:hypothetical protein T06_10313 [Trichinella sp. T6]|nr:hypothetical protein T06_10313 [Trichinella sp. T6]